MFRFRSHNGKNIRICFDCLHHDLISPLIVVFYDNRSMDDKFGASSSPFLAAPAVKKDARPGVLQRSSGKTESNSCSTEMPSYLGGKSVATSHYTSSGQDAEMQDVSGKPTDSSYLTINEKAVSSYDQVIIYFSSMASKPINIRRIRSVLSHTEKSFIATYYKYDYP